MAGRLGEKCLCRTEPKISKVKLKSARYIPTGMLSLTHCQSFARRQEKIKQGLRNLEDYLLDSKFHYFHFA